MTTEAARRATSSDDPLAATLARFLRDGDDSAMAEIVAATRPRLLAAARGIGDPRDAEDAVQGAYLALVRHRGEAMEAPVFPWLLTATLRIAYRQKAIARREAHLAALLARATSWDRGRLADSMAADEAALVRRAVATLPASYRDVVVQHHLQGLSTAETALLLDVADATVRKRLQRARSLLRMGRLARFAPLVIAAWIADRFRFGLEAIRTAAAAGGAMKTSTAVAGFVVAVALGWGAPVATTPAAPPDADDLRAEIARLQRELSTSRDAARVLEERAARTPRTRVSAGPGPEDAESPRSAQETESTSSADGSGPPARPPVVTGRHDEVLGRVDWPAAGRHYHGMLALMGAAGRAVETGAPVDIRTDARIEQHMVSLLESLSAFSDAMPAGGISKVLTHPAFLANALAASLATAGMPLSDAQRAALELLVSRHASEDAARLARYDARTFELRKVVEDGDLRARFAAAALDLLTPEQRAFASPPAFRDRLDGDFVAASLFWRDHATELRFADASSFAARASAELARAFELREDQHQGLRDAVDGWTASLPAAWFDGPDDVLAIRGRTRASVTAEIARREAEFLEGLPDALGLGAAQAERVRAFAGTWRLVRGSAK